MIDLNPTGPKTNFQHPRCYANGDYNCCSKISGEHPISANILRKTSSDNTAKVAGFKWQVPETFKTLPIAGLSSNILCGRHNSALSPLDTAMGRFFDNIGFIDAALNINPPRSIRPYKSIILFSGSTLERWMVKAIVGALASGSVKPSTLNPEHIDILYGRKEWPEHWGLYISEKSDVYHSTSFSMRSLIHPTEQTVLAVEFEIRGIPFFLCFGKPNDTAGIWHPKSLIFINDQQRIEVYLDWDNGGSDISKLYTRTGTYDGSPPDWPEWQQQG